VVDGPLSFLVGTLVLLITGVYVSAFIGNRLIISGLSGEKKLAEKTVDEINAEEDEIKSIKKTLSKVENEIGKIEEEISKHHPKS
jgi:peptidoglycan hydrolase CwlO-like protein